MPPSLKKQLLGVMPTVPAGESCLAPCRPCRGRHDDVHIAAELGEHAHQALNGDITKLPAEQPGHIGLTEAHSFAGLRLVQLGFADDRRRRQPNNRFALIPLSIAMAAIDTPGSRLRATKSRLNPSLCSRRRRGALTTCSSMMCIAALIHTIAGALDQVIVLT